MRFSSLVLAVSLTAATFAACGGSPDSGPESLGPTGDDSGITVPEDDVVSIAVAPTTTASSLTRDSSGAWVATASFTATATLRDGSTRDVSKTASWSASSPAVTVAGGTATAHGAGMFTITVSAGSASASATWKVSLTGSVTLGAVDSSKLDGAPSGAAPAFAYPLAGALFPANLAPVTLQVIKSAPSQSVARVAIKVGAGEAVDVKLYAPCEPGPRSDRACFVSLPAAFTSVLASACEEKDASITVRLADASGSSLSETAPIDVAWTTAKLAGGLYFWTTQGDRGTAIARYDFAGDGSKPEIVYEADKGPADRNGDEHCVGCHALSHDGKKLAFSIGGSEVSDFALMDVSSMKPIALRNTGPQGFATMTTFGPDGSRMVNMYKGAFTLHGTDSSLADEGPILAGVTSEGLTNPFWSPDGKWFVFSSWNTTSGEGSIGDLVIGAQIWAAKSDGVTIDAKSAKVLVPRQSGSTSYYPTVSDDGALVAFDRSSCSGPSSTFWGGGPCDSYADLSAKLLVIPPSGGTEVALTRANGEGDVMNSWPRWSPDHGTFRGKRLYWLAFSSVRPYGVQLDTPEDAGKIKPQLWFSAIAVDPNAPPTSDPSFAPVWLPGQNPDQTTPSGNHVPEWTTQAVSIIR